MNLTSVRLNGFLSRFWPWSKRGLRPGLTQADNPDPDERSVNGSGSVRLWQKLLREINARRRAAHVLTTFYCWRHWAFTPPPSLPPPTSPGFCHALCPVPSPIRVADESPTRDSGATCCLQLSRGFHEQSIQGIVLIIRAAKSYYLICLLAKHSMTHLTKFKETFRSWSLNVHV